MKKVSLAAGIVVVIAVGVFIVKREPASGPGAPAKTRIEPPPVVNQPPVLTRPFEDGYDVGYNLAVTRATKDAKLPAKEEVASLASEQAGSDAARTERWQRGFAEGYMDGFRKVATGQK